MGSVDLVDLTFDNEEEMEMARGMQPLQIVRDDRWINTDSLPGELDFSCCDLSDSNNLETVASAVLKCRKLEKLTLANCKLNENSMTVLSCKWEKASSCSQINELDVSGNEKIGEGTKAGMTFIGEVVKKSFTKRLRMRECSLHREHLVMLNASLDGYKLDELDISHALEARRKTRGESFCIEMAVSVGPDMKGFQSRPALGAGIVKMIRADDLVTPILPSVAEWLRMDNWNLSEEEQQSLQNSLSDLFAFSTLIITFGKGSRIVGKNIVASVEAKVGLEGAEIAVGGCTLVIPSLKEETKITLSSHLDRSDLNEGCHAISPVFECGPSGIQFGTPATLKIRTWLKIEKEAMISKAKIVKMLWRESENSTWKEDDDCCIASDDESHEEGVVVTYSTKHFTSFLAVMKCIEEFFVSLFCPSILLTSNLYYDSNNNITMVFCPRSDDLQKCYGENLEKKKLVAIFPFSKNFSAPLLEDIACCIEAKRFRFRGKQKAAIKFRPKSIRWPFDQNYLVCPSKTAQDPQQMHLHYVVTSGPNEGAVPALVDDWQQCRWPFGDTIERQSVASPVDREKHDATVIHLSGNATTGNIIFMGPTTAAAGSEEVKVDAPTTIRDLPSTSASNFFHSPRPSHLLLDRSSSPGPSTSPLEGSRSTEPKVTFDAVEDLEIAKNSEKSQSEPVAAQDYDQPGETNTHEQATDPNSADVAIGGDSSVTGDSPRQTTTGRSQPGQDFEQRNQGFFGNFLSWLGAVLRDHYGLSGYQPPPRM